MLLFLLSINLLLNIVLIVLTFKNCKRVDDSVDKIKERCGK
jgi:hypothetical protein